MQLSFQPFNSASELDAQRALFRACFPEAVGQATETPEHYRWKFHSAPGHPHSYEYGAYMDGELIGYYAAIPYPYKIGDRSFTAGMVCDVMTHPKARGLGIFTKLGAYSVQSMGAAGIDFVTGYPVRPEVIPGHLKVGWTITQKMPVYVKVLRGDALLRGRGLKLLAPLLNLGATFVHRSAALRGSRGYVGGELAPDEFFASDDYSTFLQRWSESVPNALRKDSNFLRWRLGGPDTTYRVFVARSPAGDLVGVCIARPTLLRGLPALALLDLMLLPEHTRAFFAVDQALQRFARSQGAEVIAAMLSSSWARKYGLTSALYVPSGHVFSLIVKKLNANMADTELLRPEVWHTMWLDSDDL